MDDRRSVSKRKDLTLGMALLFVVLWALLTHTHIDSWNEFSRLAAVEALVERGTWVIDDTALGLRLRSHDEWQEYRLICIASAALGLINQAR